MRRGQRGIDRILAIEPTSRGFGYAVLELANDQLIDWGVRQVVAAEMEQRSLPLVADLIERFAPSIIIIEDTGHPRCRRRGRGRALIDGIIEVAQTMKIAVGRVPRMSVREYYRDLGAKNKDAIARLIVARFPELRTVLPPRRKMWMPQNERMTIFDSVAFATVFACEAHVS